MQQFIEKYGSQILGTLTGWDRLILGDRWRLNYGWWDERLQAFVAKGMEDYLRQNKVLFKDHAEYVKQASERLKKESLAPSKQQDLPVVFLRSSSVEND